MSARGRTAAAGVEARVRAFIRRHRMLDGVRTLIAAVSGGPDSMALLRILSSLAPALGVRLRAAHLHHGLRGDEAGRDLALVRGACRALGVPFASGRADVRGLAARRRLSIEAAAREAPPTAKKWRRFRPAHEHSNDECATGTATSTE